MMEFIETGIETDSQTAEKDGRIAFNGYIYLKENGEDCEVSCKFLYDKQTGAVDIECNDNEVLSLFEYEIKQDAEQNIRINAEVA